MTSISEKSFGARLLKAKNVLTQIQSFGSYNPPEPTQTAAAFANFLDDISEANTVESELKQQYKANVAARKQAFRENTLSVLNLLPQIRGAVEAKFGKTSQAYEAVGEIIDKMRKSKAAVAVETDEGDQAGGAEVPDSISQSQQSYGSLLGYFNELINTLSQFAGYNPSNAAIKVANLQAFASSLDALNVGVLQKYTALHQQRQERLNLYDDLSGRVQKIKAYVKSEYGVQSGQYEAIKGVEV